MQWLAWNIHTLESETTIPYGNFDEPIRPALTYDCFTLGKPARRLNQNSSMAGRLLSLFEEPPATARWVIVWLAIL